MNALRYKRAASVAGLIVLVLVTLTCNNSTPTPDAPLADQDQAPPRPPDPGKPGDYGDAPDGSRGMDTGYYAPTGSPFWMTYDSAGVGAKFPTMGDEDPPGPFTIEVNQFWIGPLFGGSTSSDVPSIEDDADDLNDPDNVPNLMIQSGGADCDRENGSHNPSGTGCAPVPAYSIPMNARLVIVFGYPPLGIWITSVTAAEDMSYNGPIFWNLAIDLNQDGSWGGSEWIARDIPVNLMPGETKTLISPAFRMSTSGTPWGRLNFPFWVRSMVTSESIQDRFADWDGRGIEEGFAFGEVEDYFVEWQPIGQRFPNREPLQSTACSLASTDRLEQVPTVRNTWDVLKLQPGVNVDSLQVIGVEDTTTGGVAVPIELVSLSLASIYPVTVGENTLNVIVGENRDVRFSPENISPLGANLLAMPLLMDNAMCPGSAPVGVSSGLSIPFTHLPSSGFQPYGMYDFQVSIFEDFPLHGPHIAMWQSVVIYFEETNSIIFRGPHPWVNVIGEYNQNDGSFSAEGTGTVAGYSNIAVAFEGVVTEDGLTGEYMMGVEGGLPGGGSITYAIEGTKIEEPIDEAPIPLSEGVLEAIDAFIQVFNGAFQDGDPEPLYQLLNPAVIELYGEEACQAYFETIIETPTEIEFIDATRVGAWNWERDDVTTPVDFAYAVNVNFTAGGQTTQQEMHLTLPGDDSVRWFTDCGDPLP